jgi:hypothetical protein
MRMRAQWAEILPVLMFEEVDHGTVTKGMLADTGWSGPRKWWNAPNPRSGDLQSFEPMVNTVPSPRHLASQPVVEVAISSDHEAAQEVNDVGLRPLTPTRRYEGEASASPSSLRRSRPRRWNDAEWACPVRQFS